MKKGESLTVNATVKLGSKAYDATNVQWSINDEMEKNGSSLTFTPVSYTHLWDANKVILEHIKESGHLMGVQHITHQYPHCWRCHHPIILNRIHFREITRQGLFELEIQRFLLIGSLRFLEREAKIVHIVY